MGGKETLNRMSKGEVLKFCPKCGSSMVDAALYDPEGTVPLVIETDSSGRMWACTICSPIRTAGGTPKEVAPLPTFKLRRAMKTLDEFNAERRKDGIACPKCGKELLDSSPSITLTSHPPQKNIHCDACGYRGFRIA